MSNPPFKKILAVLIVIFAGGAAFFLGSKILQRQNIEKQKAAVVKCLTETAKMTDEQLVEKINDLSSQNEGSQQLSEIRRQMVGYLFCNFNNSDKSEGIYEETKSFINKLAIQTLEAKESAIKNLTDIYSAAEKDNAVAFSDTLTGMLAIGDLTKVCPDKLPDRCVKAITEFSKQNNIIVVDRCKDACNSLVKYSEDKDKLEKEVINFKEWDSNPIKQKPQYYVRYAAAYRFGGKEVALKVCNNLTNIANREDCISKVNDFVSAIAKEEEAKRNCASQLKELENLICSVSK